MRALSLVFQAPSKTNNSFYCKIQNIFKEKLKNQIPLPRHNLLAFWCMFSYIDILFFFFLTKGRSYYFLLFSLMYTESI